MGNCFANIDYEQASQQFRRGKYHHFFQMRRPINPYSNRLAKKEPAQKVPFDEEEMVIKTKELNDALIEFAKTGNQIPQTRTIFPNPYNRSKQ